MDNLVLLMGAAAALEDHDEAKKMLIYIKVEEAVRLQDLNQTGRNNAQLLSSLNLLGSVKMRDGGELIPWAVLTPFGKELVEWKLDEWIDESQRWEELEGRGAKTITAQEDGAELNAIIARKRAEQERN